MNDISKNNKADHILVHKVLSGDTNAFSIIISNTERLVAQIVFKMISNNEDKKDIAQDIYLKAFKNLSSFKYQSKLSTWIGTIAYNTCLNHIGKKKLVFIDTTFKLENDCEEELEIINSKAQTISTNDTYNLIFQKELSEILTSEIEILSPVYKTLITLYHNEELSYSEISQITSLPEGTVKNYLFRARKMLKDSILRKYKKEDL